MTVGATQAWVWRNHQVAEFDGFVRLTPLVYDSQATVILARTTGKSLDVCSTDLQKMSTDEPGAAQRIIKEHPLLFVQIYGSGLLRTAIDPGGIDAAKQLKLYPPDGLGLIAKVNEEGLVWLLTILMKERSGAFVLNLLLGAYLPCVYYWAFKGLRLHFATLFPLFCLGGCMPRRVTVSP